MAITADRLSRFQRYLIPSFADLLFLFLLIAHTRSNVLSDGDTGWHLWAGYDALAHGPRVVPDPLSWSRPGTSWMSLQWLGEAAFALVHRHGGFVGVAFLATATFAATFSWFYRSLLRECRHAPVALGIATLASAAAWPHLLARPEVFAFPLFLAALAVLRKPDRQRWAAVVLPLITALWANCHPSAILAPSIGLMAWWLHPRQRGVALATVLAALALGATPSGFGWLRELVPTREGLRYLGMIDEWSSPHFREPRYWPLGVAILLSLWARRRGEPLRAREAMLGLAWLAVTLTTARAGAFALLYWSSRLARDLAAPTADRRGFWNAFKQSIQPFEDVLKPVVWPIAITMGVLVGAPLMVDRLPVLARGFTDRDLPLAAVEHANRAALGTRVFNDYGWGGYLSWDSRGRWKVFIDGRAGFFGPDVLADYLRVLRLEPGWDDTLNRRAPDWILVRTREPLVTAAPLTGRWQVAYRDSLASILVPLR